MLIRDPNREDFFYPGFADACRQAVGELATAPTAVALNGERVYGGIVPHSGWADSGAVAGEVFATLAGMRQPAVMVIFGAMHNPRGRHAAMFGSGRWQTPIGPVEIDSRFAERVLGHTNLIIDDPYAHEEEHSIEVQMPFVRQLLPGVKLLPIAVPAIAEAPEVGEAVARTAQSYKYDLLVVGSSDLTHYGPNHGLTCQGAGLEAHRWAKEVNDRRMIELMLGLEADNVVSEAASHRNACGSGAIAATIAAVKRLGASRGILLSHVNSLEVLEGRLQPLGSEDSVGFAGVLFAGQN